MTETANKNHKGHILYLAVVGLVFLAMAVIFLFFPRSRYSELEKRELATFPDFSTFSQDPAAYTQAVSNWFSDSEPYRDRFMNLSMNIRNTMKVTVGSPDEAISYKSTGTGKSIDMEVGIDDLEELVDNSGNPMAGANSRIASSGVMVVGSGENIRGLSLYGGSATAGGKLVEAANKYAETFPNVNVYALVAPLATEFYIPDKAAKSSRPQLPTLENIRDNLSPKVKYVDAYHNIKAHTLEDVYLRTDHHWSPLGAFYAAQAFANTAGVPFKKLDSYDQHVVHGFVGSMYGYSNDINIKNNPEDFVYYTPKGVDYTTTFVTYSTNKSYQVVSESKPYESAYFKTYKDGSGLAYNTFMGGDQHLVKVKTDTPGNRKLLVIKDSYGNAIPGYLFYSFPEIHVVDFRYFTKNMKQYVAENGITDILLAFNIYNACSSGAMQKITNMLTQSAGIHASPDKPAKPTTVEPEKPAARKPAAPNAPEHPREASPSIGCDSIAS